MPRTSTRPVRNRTEFEILAHDRSATMADHRRHPLCRLLLWCALCGWARDYNPERIIQGLRAKGHGGYPTPVGRVASLVQWPCPGCGRVKWASQLAYPNTIDAREIARAARDIRS
jgi:hypothetical protein